MIGLSLAEEKGAPACADAWQFGGGIFKVDMVPAPGLEPGTL